MALQYVGNCNWEPTSPPDWTVDSWGVDHAKWTWMGRPSLMAAFRQTLAGFRTMMAFGTVVAANASVRLTDYSENNSSKPWMPSIDLSFTGFRDGKIPPVKAVNSLSSQSAQGEGNYNNGDDTYSASGTIQYRASRTVWTWFETSTPAELPRYSVVQLPLNPFKSITRQQITITPTGDTTAPPPSNLIPLAAFSTVMRSLVPVMVVSDYSREPILPGALWACSSTVDYVLQ